LDQAQKKAAALQDAGVWELVDKKQLRPAMAACQQLNRDYPGYAPGWHSASQLAMQSKRLEAALYYIENAVELEPDRTDWLLQ